MFRDHGPALTMAERAERMTDSELQKRADALALRLLDGWRAGDRSPRTVWLLARVAARPGIAECLTGQEQFDLGAAP